jgi:hypothetical protein
MEQRNSAQNRSTTPTQDADKLMNPALALFKAQCRSVITFLKAAHERQVENAKRMGVSPDDLHRYTSAGTEFERKHALDAIRATLRSAHEGHTGSFPDYLGAARLLKEFYRGVKGGAPGSIVNDPKDPRSPTSVARAHADMLFLSLQESSNQDQRGQSILLLNSLINKTALTLAPVSSEIRARFDHALQNGFSAPAWQNRRSA